MSRGDPHWSEPKWLRFAVRDGGAHVGSVTTVSYPNRDLTAFPEGSPYFEVVIADLAERHVALIQRFRQHWLIHCGYHYETTIAEGVLTASQITELAVHALRHQTQPAEVLAATVRANLDRLLTPSAGPPPGPASKVSPSEIPPANPRRPRT